MDSSSTNNSSNVKETADDNKENIENIEPVNLKIDFSEIIVKEINKDKSSDNTQNPVQDINKISDNSIKPEKSNIRRKLFLPKDDLLKVTKEDFIPKFVKSPPIISPIISPTLEQKHELRTEKSTLLTSADSIKTNIGSTNVQKSDSNFVISEDSINLPDKEIFPEQPGTSFDNYTITKKKINSHICSSPVFNQKQYMRNWVDSVNEEYLPSTYEASNYPDQERIEDDTNNINKQQTDDVREQHTKRNDEESDETYDITFLDCKIKEREENMQKAKEAMFDNIHVHQTYKKLGETFQLYFGWHSSSEEQNEDIATILEAKKRKKTRKSQKLSRTRNIAVETERRRENEQNENTAAASKESNNRKEKRKKTPKYQAAAGSYSTDERQIKAKSAISQHTDSSSDSNIKHVKKKNKHAGKNDEIVLSPVKINATRNTNARNKPALLYNNFQKQKIITEQNMQNMPKEVQDLFKENIIISLKIKNLIKMGLSVIPIISLDKSLDNKDKNDDDTSSNTENSSKNIISRKQKPKKKKTRREYERYIKKKATKENDPKSDKSKSNNESNLDKQSPKISSNNRKKTGEHTKKRTKIRVRSIEELTNPSISLLASTSEPSCSMLSQASSKPDVSSKNPAPVESISPSLKINIFEQSLIKSICMNFQYCRSFYQKKINNKKENKIFFKSLAVIKKDLIILRNQLCIHNVLGYINEVMQLTDPISSAEYNTYVFWTKRLKYTSSSNVPVNVPNTSSTTSPNSCDPPSATSHQNQETRSAHQRNIDKPMYFRRISRLN